jgi:hypothetical protein
MRHAIDFIEDNTVAFWSSIIGTLRGRTARHRGGKAGRMENRQETQRGYRAAQRGAERKRR